MESAENHWVFAFESLKMCVESSANHVVALFDLVVEILYMRMRFPSFSVSFMTDSGF